MSNIKDLATPQTFELFYYNLRTSIMRNRKDDVGLYLSLIKDSMDYNPNLLNCLGEYEQSELLKLIKIAKGGVFPLVIPDSYQDGSDSFETIIGNAAYQMDEKDLQLAVFRGDITKINEIIKRDLRVITIEHPISEGDRCDITAIDDSLEEFWILELKSGIADHRIVGQCVKYIQHFEDRLIYKIYKKVKCLTICNGYKRFAIQELNRLGVDTLKYENVCGSISYEKVN